MKKIVFILLAFSFSLNVFSQRPQTVGGIPQTSMEPSASDIARQKRAMEERKAEYIQNFLTTLKGDAFQIEITRQTLNSFFDKKVELLSVGYERSIDRNDAIKKLEQAHFKDLKDLISEEDMIKVNDLISGKFDELEVKKEKKKKKKRKKDKS